MGRRRRRGLSEIDAGGGQGIERASGEFIRSLSFWPGAAAWRPAAVCEKHHAAIAFRTRSAGSGRRRMDRAGALH